MRKISFIIIITLLIVALSVLFGNEIGNDKRVDPTLNLKTKSHE